MSRQRFVLEEMAPGELVPNPANFRRHPALQRTALEASISEHGWVDAPLFNKKTGHLIDGHARVELALANGEALIPVKVVEMPLAQERRLLRSFDAIGAMALVDDEALAALIESIDDAALEQLLGEVEEPASGLLPEADPDALPDVVETRCKPGDLWQLGEHRLLCGDATKREDVERLMGGKKAALMSTDPPYGVALDQGWRDRAGLNWLGDAQADVMDGDDSAMAWTAALALTEADVAYVWHADVCHTIVSEALEAAGFEVRQQIVWVKTVHTLSRAAYHWKHEPCWFAVRKGVSMPWMVGRDQMTVWEAASPRQIMSGSSEAKEDHPTQKPILLSLIPIENHTRPSEIVYDPFAGSGTTIIACEQTGRVARCLEIEPRYVDVCLARYEQATGREAIRI